MLAAVIENELYIVFRQNYTEISRNDFLVNLKWLRDLNQIRFQVIVSNREFFLRDHKCFNFCLVIFFEQTENIYKVFLLTWHNSQG